LAKFGGARFTVKARRGSRRVYVYLSMLHEDAIQALNQPGGVTSIIVLQECSAFQRPRWLPRPMSLYHMDLPQGSIVLVVDMSNGQQASMMCGTVICSLIHVTSVVIKSTTCLA
jgi:hypothetical protein